MPLLSKCLLEIVLVVGQVQITLMAKALETKIRRAWHTYSEKIAEMKCSSGKVLDNLRPVNVPRGMTNRMITGREPIINRRCIKKHICAIRLHASGCSFDNFGPVTHSCMALKGIILNRQVVLQRKSDAQSYQRMALPLFLWNCSPMPYHKPMRLYPGDGISEVPLQVCRPVSRESRQLHKIFAEASISPFLESMLTRIGASFPAPESHPSTP